jgi:hypothetical protein
MAILATLRRLWSLGVTVWRAESIYPVAQYTCKHWRSKHEDLAPNRINFLVYLCKVVVPNRLRRTVQNIYLKSICSNQ